MPQKALWAAVWWGVLAPWATPAPVRVRPGTLLRWTGDGITSCQLGGRRFAPLAGACLYPVDLLRPTGPLSLLRWRGKRRETTQVVVSAYDYPTQELSLPAQLVDLSPADLARVRRENAVVAQLWARDGERRFSLPLGPPLDPLPAAGHFGDRRRVNGRMRSPHAGADYAASEGASVLAADDGVVALVADQLLPGRCVFVDHGDSLITLYFHLSRVDVAEGEAVRRGALIGRVGSTGRVTGPHLHFGVRWRGARLDPAWLLAPAQDLPAVP